MNETRAPAENARNASALPSPDVMRRRRARRYFTDGAARWIVRAGGGGVVVALALIFVYLFSEVVPLLRGASVEPMAEYSVPGGAGASTSRLYLERYGELGMRYTDDGRLIYFDLISGDVRESFDLPVPEGVSVTAVGNAQPRARRVVYGLSDGTALVVEHGFELRFPSEGVREVVPAPDYPLGREPVVVDAAGSALEVVTVQLSDDNHGIVARTADDRVLFARFTRETSLLTGEAEISSRIHELPRPPERVTHLQVSSNLWTVIGADRTGHLVYWDIDDPARASIQSRLQAVDEPDEDITALQFLNGTFSAVVGTSAGRLSQWFLVRSQPGENLFHLERARTFDRQAGAITSIQAEYTRKGFLAVDDSGGLGIHYGTSSRTLLNREMADGPLAAVGVSPVDDQLVIQARDGRLMAYDLWNAHPEASFAAFWNRIWYEGRADPEYVWQASSGADSFEPKYSLVPLTVGTLKAAFFAMLFAMPLGILGAVYTAYFMAPKLRGFVKPTIEVMEAMPTVILGFLAGLWLAPFLENHIPAVFSILLGLPLACLLFAFMWHLLPKHLRDHVPDGWEAVMLIPVIVLVVWGCVVLSPLIEVWFFNGSMRQWFTDIGINYDQRNAMVVGIAMGFAVIPTIFSIAEDAVFTVPRHLTNGSLALGATRWQTVTRVVILTASPGIFSAVMIGFGRAVGETMIVLMATGNSPVVNFNIFEGMRTLSANIAVELPETAVASTHFRVLFLAALVLFGLTFIVNTLAEIVRQRLRARYSSL